MEHVFILIRTGQGIVEGLIAVYPTLKRAEAARKKLARQMCKDEFAYTILEVSAVTLNQF